MSDQQKEVERRVREAIDVWLSGDSENTLPEFLGWTVQETADFLLYRKIPKSELKKKE